MAKKKILIVGGGASGMIAAIVAARNGAKVTIIERKDRVGKKILATGNGRCNLTNKHIETQRFHSDSKNIFESIYTQFDLEATTDFFRSIGIEVLELEEGKLYPFSLQAASVLNVLRDELERLSVAILCDVEVTSFEVGKQIVVITNKSRHYMDKVILATGGQSSPDLGSNGSGYILAKQLGLTLKPVYPSLIQLTSSYHYLKHLKGTKVMSNIGLFIDGERVKTEYGELLFTDYGLSGPPILQLSREASKAKHNNSTKVFVEIDLVPSMSEDSLDAIMQKRIDDMPYKTLEQFFVGLLPKQLIVPIIKDNDFELTFKAADISKIMRAKLIQWLKHLTIEVTGTKQWKQSQVTAGGIDCHMVDETTLATTKYPNIYICGELLDMDADCGGFNLQWAWSSGYVAGTYASQG